MIVARYGVWMVLAAAAAPGPVWAEDASAGERIARVERGLLPAVVFQGESGRPADIASRMRYHKVPGLGIAVIEGGRLRWARGYGVTAAGGQTPVSPATLFQAGAASKPVAALAALLLVQEGTLDLDADVNDRLVSWKVPENPFTASQKVTLRQLLSHTAGVNVDGFPGYAAGEPLPTLVQVLGGAAPARSAAVVVDQVPGSAFRQSGGAFVIVQQLLEDVTKEAFAGLARRTVLSRLGMDDSTYEQPLPAGRAAAAARGHRADGAAVEGGWRVYPEQCAAGLWTTPSDLARFAVAVAAAADGGGEHLLTRETARLMLTPQAKNAALGLFVDGAGEAEHFSHAGRNAGFDAVMVMYPRAGCGAVVMMNANNNSGMAAEVLDSVAKEYGWPGHRPAAQREVFRVDPDTLHRYEGSYRVKGGPAVAVRCEGDRLFVNFPGLGTTELFGESETTFFVAPAPLRFTFEIGAGGGAADTLVIKANGQSQTAAREPAGN